MKYINTRLGINDTQPNDTQLNDTLLGVVMLSVVEPLYQPMTEHYSQLLNFRIMFRHKYKNKNHLWKQKDQPRGLHCKAFYNSDVPFL
jgi:hypothetical protein